MTTASKIVIGTLVAILILTAAVFSIGDSRRQTEIDVNQNRRAASKERYESRLFGFSFEYPANRDLVEYRAENISIGTRGNNTEGVQSDADVTVLQRVNGDKNYKNYEEFLYDKTRMMCAADSPGATTNCTMVEQVQPFTASSGSRGSTFYLREETKIVGANATTTYEVKGPFFAFNLSTNATTSPYVALVVHPPISLPSDQVDSAFVRSIADSVKINRLDR